MDGENQERTLLVIGAPEHDAAAYHLAGFLAPDPVIALRAGGAAGETHLGVSAMEYGRAKKEARAGSVLSYDELGVMKLARELKSGGRALAAATANLLRKIGANAPIAVPPDFGIVYADELRARGLTVIPDARLFANLRRQKTEEEISLARRYEEGKEARP